MDQNSQARAKSGQNQGAVPKQNIAKAKIKAISKSSHPETSELHENMSTSNSSNVRNLRFRTVSTGPTYQSPSVSTKATKATKAPEAPITRSDTENTVFGQILEKMA